MADHDITVLNTLITTTIDSANGFENSAEDASAQRFEQMFREMGRERREVTGRLQQRVRELGGDPADDGSLKADVHRRWQDLKNSFSDGDDKAVIDEVERGEDYIKNKYEMAMEDDKLTPETRTLISDCYQSVRKGHDRASQLKHSMADATA